jgi:3-hydroxybutyryl-CoA dehydrogenase
MNIATLGVIGAGQMGAGIAQTAAMAGIRVSLSDLSEGRLDRGRAAIASSLERLVGKQVLTAEQAQQVQQRIHWTTAIEAHGDKPFVIEAVSEDEELKKAIFTTINQICSGQAILASNTSSISITRLAATVSHPQRFIGMHFMNPVPIMQLVEVIRGMETSDETCQQTMALAERMGKTTTLAEDFPGFIANRILMPMINEAFFAMMEGVGKAEDIDTTMRLGANQPMGPLALADLIGLDTCLAVMRVLYAELGDSKYRPCPLLRNYVAAGRLGRKARRGVYDYGPAGEQPSGSKQPPGRQASGRQPSR